MKRTPSSSSSSCSRLSQASTPCRVASHKGVSSHDAKDTLEKPTKHGFMMTCWRNGQRVLMHSDEVARMMQKKSSSSSLPDSSSSSCAGLPSAPMRPSDTSQRDMDYRVKPGGDEGSGASAEKQYDMTPPPIVPRGRWLADNEGWQMLAKEMVRVARHPPRCHKSICRRTKKCAGGENACYLAEFELIDVLMQRHVLPALKRGYEAAKAAENL